MKENNVTSIYSWSKFNTYKTSWFEYFLKYVIKKKEDNANSIYTYMGSLAHDILEKFYTKEIEYKDMISLFDDGWFTLNIGGYKFDRTNEEKNEKVSKSYQLNMQHFFKNHKELTSNVEIERFLTIKVGNFLFHGYVDLIRKDEDGNFIIQDWKSSSIYSGKKIDKEKGQLVLYAEGLRQMGVPLEKIKICWNFLKYCTVTITQANGKTADRNIERNGIGEALRTNVKMWLKKSDKGYTEDQIEDYLDLLVQTNSIECLPKEIQSKYKFDDCYVFIPLDKTVINDLKVDIIDTLNEIITKENEYHNTLNEKLFWDEDVEKESFYFAVLCGYSANAHKPYGEYLDMLNQKKESKENVFGGVGSEIKEDDLSWLNEI